MHLAHPLLQSALIALVLVAAGLVPNLARAFLAPIRASLSIGGGSLGGDYTELDEGGFLADVSVTGGHQLASILFPAGGITKGMHDGPSRSNSERRPRRASTASS
jgi:hypothetical protein